MNEVAPALKERLSILVKELGQMEQVDCPLRHYFAPGVYLREIFMPADSVVIGKIHRTEHFNIIQKGRVRVAHGDGTTMVLEGPCTFVSKAGVQKTLYIETDTIWTTIHITSETDLAALESALIEPDDSYPVFDRAQERMAIEAASMNKVEEQ